MRRLIKALILFAFAIMVIPQNANAYPVALIDDEDIYEYEHIDEVDSELIGDIYEEEVYEDEETYEEVEAYDEEYESEEYEDEEYEYEEEYAYYPSYDDYDLYVLSHVIYGEASGCSWDMLIAVGSVVLNRVYDSRYPDTIAGVVFQEGQYSCQSGGEFYRGTDDACTEAAIYLLENGSQLPSYVIYQSQFIQGDGIYMTIGNTYFCY